MYRFFCRRFIEKCSDTRHAIQPKKIAGTSKPMSTSAYIGRPPSSVSPVSVGVALVTTRTCARVSDDS